MCTWYAYRRCKSSYIQILNLVLIGSLILPIQLYEKQNTKPIYSHTEIVVAVVPTNIVVPPPTPVPHPVRAKKAVIAKGPRTVIAGDIYKDGECVTLVKDYLGVTNSWGVGGSKITPNLLWPEIDAAVLFYGHAAIVKGITASGMLILLESNLHWDGKVTMGRQVPIWDSTIRGFYKPPS